MTATEILNDCRRLGVALAADATNLICKAPKGILTPQLTEVIRAHKFDLLSLLTDGDYDARADTHIEPRRHVASPPWQSADFATGANQDDGRTAEHPAGVQSGTHAVAEKLLIIEPDGPCLDCSSGQWWQLPGEAWHCRACEPDMPLRATTLTLSCHKV